MHIWSIICFPVSAGSIFLIASALSTPLFTVSGFLGFDTMANAALLYSLSFINIFVVSSVTFLNLSNIMISPISCISQLCNLFLNSIMSISLCIIYDRFSLIFLLNITFLNRGFSGKPP